jgi:hypothetical protein
MSTIINATTTNGVVIQPDNSGSLVLQTNSGTTALTIDTSQRAAFVAGTAALPAITTTGNTNTGIFFPAADTIAFAEGGAESMRLDSSGNVSIGSTAGGADERLWVQTTNADWCVQTNSTGSGTFYHISFRANGTQVGSITSSSTTTSYTTSSDYRLKENIAPMTGALDKVSALKPVTYKWKIDGSNGQGFIAHELQAVVPDCVTGEKDAVDEDGTIKPQSIDTSFLVATLTAAIQEQNKIINDLKARVETLEGAKLG